MSSKDRTRGTSTSKEKAPGGRPEGLNVREINQRKGITMTQELIESQVFSMEPKTLDEALKYADLIAKSTLVPKDYQNQPGNVLIALQMARELGIPGLQALQNIAVINGRPALWGDLLPALILGSGKCEDFREDFDEKTMTATCSMKRKGQPTVIIRSFSMEDAKKAGLWEKKSKDGWPSTWCTYPKRMLQMRARSWCARDGFSDVLKGLSIAEEQMDVESAPVVEALPAPAMPKRLSEATPQTASQVVSEWRHIQTTKEGICGVCKEKIPAGVQATYSPKQGLRCGNCDPLAGPPEEAKD